MYSHGASAPPVIPFVILGVVYAVLLVFVVWGYVRIIRRAGYSGWWVLMGLVPIGNLVMFFLFAFRQWPAQRELEWLRSQVEGGQGGPRGLYGS